MALVVVGILSAEARGREGEGMRERTRGQEFVRARAQIKYAHGA